MAVGATTCSLLQWLYLCSLCYCSSCNTDLPWAAVWPGDVVIRALDLRLRRSRVQSPSVLLSDNNPGQVVHARVPLSQNSIIWCRSRGGDALRLGR